MKHLFTLTVILIISSSCTKDLPPLKSGCLQLAQSSILADKLVYDSHAELKEDTITLVIVVNNAMNIQTAREYGKAYLNLTKKICGDEIDNEYGIGRTNYDYMIGVFTKNTERKLAHGAKVGSSPVITW